MQRELIKRGMIIYMDDEQTTYKRRKCNVKTDKRQKPLVPKLAVTNVTRREQIKDWFKTWAN